MRTAALSGIVITAFLAGQASGVVLYDGTLGTTPDAQSWTYLALDLINGTVQTTQSWAGGVTTLDSSVDEDDMAGYSSIPPHVPVLDRSGNGYTVRFQARVVSESHSSLDRAGFSVIAISSDGQHGIELGFWTNEIWAQNDLPLFTHGEGVARDTTTAVTEYDLAVRQDQYWLLTGGAVILTGAIRDYTAFGGLIDPYETPSFLFFGDDTSSAGAQLELARVEVLDYATPEPGALALLSAGAAVLLPLRFRRRRAA